MRAIVTHQDMVESKHAADIARQRVIAESGVFNVRSGELRQWHELFADYLVIEARFHSSAWTGY